jgi:hypothetical protein
MYRMPFVALFTIFFPLWNLSLYSLFMYYQDITDYSMRIANSITIILSVFAYIPTIREQLPSTPTLLMAEMLVYLISFTFILSIIQGYIVFSYDPSTYSMQWKNDAFFISALAINLFTFVTVLALSCMYIFKWKHDYSNSGPEVDPKFNRHEWKN